MEGEHGCVLEVKSNDSDRVPSQVASAYQRALDMYNARVQLEKQISRQDTTDTERLNQYIVCSIYIFDLPDPFGV